MKKKTKPAAESPPPAETLACTLAIGQIDPSPAQTRKQFPAGEIEDLAASIRSVGLLQPIVVRQCGKRYELIAGERRLRAAGQAEIEQIAADDRQAARMTAIENLQRKDVDPIEEAEAFKALLADGTTESGLAGSLGRHTGQHTIVRDESLHRKAAIENKAVENKMVRLCCELAMELDGELIPATVAAIIKGMQSFLDKLEDDEQ